MNRFEEKPLETECVAEVQFVIAAVVLLANQIWTILTRIVIDLF